MKRFFIQFFLLLVAVLASKGEVRTRDVVIGGTPDSFSSVKPIDIQSASSSAMLRYGDIIKYNIGVDEKIKRIAFKGYNPGSEQTRHVKLSINCNNWTGYTVVFDGDCVIPHGGTADDCIELLSIELDEPFAIYYYYLDIQVESTGEPSDAPVFFELCNYTAVATITVETETASFTGTVTDQDGLPIQRAKVTLSGQLDSYDAETDDVGRFTVTAENSKQNFQVRVTAKGHAPYVGDKAFALVEGKVLQPKKTSEDFTLYGRLSFYKDKRATIILPEAPNTEWGRYYQPKDRRGRDTIIFERVWTPQADTPYVIFPEYDFEVDLDNYEQPGAPGKIVIPWPHGIGDDSVPYISLCGSYENRKIPNVGGYMWLLDSTSDCESNGPYDVRVGGYRAYLVGASTDKPVFCFEGETSHVSSPYTLESVDKSSFDLQGRRLYAAPTKGIYIKGGRKQVVH
jgi:hypothetical protein